MRDIVYFDLETRHSAAEVGGWHNTAEMRLSVGVTYSTASGKYTIYSEEMVDDLIRQLPKPTWWWVTTTSISTMACCSVIRCGT